MDEELEASDGSWILKNAFTVLTMQSGFGLLEAGCVSGKSATSIMVKNVVDVVFGGLVYWAVGFGLSFGPAGSGFAGGGGFFVTADEGDRGMGTLYATYVFHFSFASAATTIVSGAIAERMKLSAYVLFSMMSVPVYAIVACWVWSNEGFLKALGFYDFAGSSVVHLGGGASALSAALFLGPRVGRFTEKDAYGLASPVTALTGTMLLWWAWLAFNAGSTFRITGSNWRLACKVSIVTLNGSIGGGAATFLLDSVLTFRDHVIDVGHLCTGLLSGLVGVTGCCAVVAPGEGLFVGAVAALLARAAEPLLQKYFRLDDPVSSVPVHFVAGVWGTLATGVFGRRQFCELPLPEQQGLLSSGSFRQLGIQALGVVCISLWWMGWTFFIFALLRYTTGLRVSVERELIGPDWNNHRVGHSERQRAEQARRKSDVAILAIPEADDLGRAIQKVLGEVSSTPWFRNRIAAELGRQGGAMPNMPPPALRPSTARVSNNFLGQLGSSIAPMDNGKHSVIGIEPNWQ